MIQVQTEMEVADNTGANTESNDGKGTAIKSNSDDGAKLSPAKLAAAVQGDQDGEPPA